MIDWIIYAGGLISDSRIRNICVGLDTDLIDEIASFLRSSINPTNLAVGEGQTQAVRVSETNMYTLLIVST